MLHIPEHACCRSITKWTCLDWLKRSFVHQCRRKPRVPIPGREAKPSQAGPLHPERCEPRPCVGLGLGMSQVTSQVLHVRALRLVLSSEVPKAGLSSRHRVVRAGSCACLSWNVTEATITGVMASQQSHWSCLLTGYHATQHSSDYACQPSRWKYKPQKTHSLPLTLITNDMELGFLLGHDLRSHGHDRLWV